MILVLIVVGLWIYNSSQTEQAARLAVYYAAVTNNSSEAEYEARKYLRKSLLAAEVEHISAYAYGDIGRGRVITKMETFLPGLKKLFAPGEAGWTGQVTIEKEAMTVRDV